MLPYPSRSHLFLLGKDCFGSIGSGGALWMGIYNLVTAKVFDSFGDAQTASSVQEVDKVIASWIKPSWIPLTMYLNFSDHCSRSSRWTMTWTLPLCRKPTFKLSQQTFHGLLQFAIKNLHFCKQTIFSWNGTTVSSGMALIGKINNWICVTSYKSLCVEQRLQL